jgi:hypothetical protein
VGPYLEKTHHKKGLVRWLKVKSPSSIPAIEKKKKRPVMVKGRERKLNMTQITEGRGKVCISARLWGTDMSFRGFVWFFGGTGL